MHTQRLIRKLGAFFGFVDVLAELSNCKLKQRGAIVVPKDFSEVLSVGYNGPPRNTDNDSCTGVKGACGCVHAEANAVIKLREKAGILLCSTAPCIYCAGLIINSTRILGVVYSDEKKTNSGLQTLHDAHIPYTRLDDARICEWWTAR